MRRLGLLLSFLLVSASACVELPGGLATTPTPSARARPVSRPTATVTRGSIVESIKLLGRIASVNEAELYFKNAGRIKALSVQPGQEVKDGQLVAELETGDLVNRIATSQANLDTARLKLEQEKAKQGDAVERHQRDLRTAQLAVSQAEVNVAKAQSELARAKTLPGAVEKAQTDVERARLALADAQKNLEIVQKSPSAAKNVRDRESERNWYEVRYGETLAKFDAGQASKAELDADWANLVAAKERYESALAEADRLVTQARTTVLDAQDKLRQAEAELAKQQALPPGSDLKPYENAVTDAQLALDRAKADYARKLAGDDSNTDLALLEKQVEQAQAQLDLLKQEENGSRLVSPIAGRVISARGRPGEQVSAYQTIAIVADPSQLEVKGDLLEADVTKVALGQKVQLTVDTMPGVALTGEVVRLPSGLSGGQSGAVDRTVEIKVAWPRPPQLGMLARSTILIRQKDDVLIVPAKAVRTVGKRTFVEYFDGDVRRGANVELGIVTDTEAEITSGLKEGQVVLVGQ